MKPTSKTRKTHTAPTNDTKFDVLFPQDECEAPDVTSRQCPPPPQKQQATGEQDGAQVFGPTVLGPALKAMSKSEAMETNRLIEAYYGDLCCAQEMFAAMLDLLGPKSRQRLPLRLFLMGVAYMALRDMGMTDAEQYVDMIYYVATGGVRTKASLARLMAVDEARLFFRSECMSEICADPETPAHLNEPTLVLDRARGTRTVLSLTDVAASTLACITGLVAGAKQNRRPAVHVMPQVLRVVSDAGLSDLDADFCVWLGCDAGEHVGGLMRSHLDRMSIFSPWFVGIRRARTSAEMLRDAGTVAAA
jgi:hypothetical protein